MINRTKKDFMKNRTVVAHYFLNDCDFNYTYTRYIPSKRLNGHGYYLCLFSQHKATQRMLDLYYADGMKPKVGDEIYNDIVHSKLKVTAINGKNQK